MGKPITLSGGPVIFELPLSYPDLVFTREWGGNFITGTVGDYVQMVTRAQVVTHDQIETVIRQRLLVLMIMFWTSVNDLCIWYSVGDYLVLRFIF